MFISFKESRDKIGASSTILPLKKIMPEVIILKQLKNIYRQLWESHMTRNKEMQHIHVIFKQ